MGGALVDRVRLGEQRSGCPGDTVRGVAEGEEVSAVAYTDLFALGLGFDFAGALMLSRGLLTRPEEVMSRMMQSRQSFARFNVRDAEDHADGLSGVVALCLGFGLQATGYVIQIGGAHAHHGGLRAMGVAALCAVLGGAAAFGLGQVLRWPLIRRFLIEVARWDESKRHELPDPGELYGYGVLLGRQSAEGLRAAGDYAAYADLVWKTRTREDPE